MRELLECLPFPRAQEFLFLFLLTYPVMPTLPHVCALWNLLLFSVLRGVSLVFEILMLLATTPQRVGEAGVPS